VFLASRRANLARPFIHVVQIAQVLSAFPILFTLFARSPFHKLLPVVRISVVAASFPARSVRVLFRWFRAVEFKRVVVCASRDGSAFVIASPFFRHIMIRNTPEILVRVLRRRRASHFSCGKSKGNARAQLFPYYSSFQLFSSHPHTQKSFPHPKP